VKCREGLARRHFPNTRSFPFSISNSDSCRCLDVVWSAYYTNIKDMISAIPEPGYSLPVPENYQQVTTRGMDLTFKGNWEGIAAQLGGTIQSTIDNSTDLEISNSADQSAHYLLSVPVYRQKLFATLEGNYTGFRESYDGYWLDPYMVTDFTIFGDHLLPNLDLTFKVRNLCDVSYTEPLGEMPALVEEVPQPGRTYEVKATVRF
jgi:iron complex outermembrane receptor protein